MINERLSFLNSQLSFDYGGLAQLARAPALHAGGQRFESVILHNETIYDILNKAKSNIF